MLYSYSRWYIILLFQGHVAMILMVFSCSGVILAMIELLGVVLACCLATIIADENKEKLRLRRINQQHLDLKVSDLWKIKFSKNYNFMIFHIIFYKLAKLERFLPFIFLWRFLIEFGDFCRKLPWENRWKEKQKTKSEVLTDFLTFGVFDSFLKKFAKLRFNPFHLRILKVLLIPRLTSWRLTTTKKKWCYPDTSIRKSKDFLTVLFGHQFHF